MKRLIPVFLALVLLLSACSSKKSVLPATLDSDGTPQSESQQEVQLQAMPPAEKAEQNVNTEPDWLSLYAPVFNAYQDFFALVDAYRQGNDSPVDLIHTQTAAFQPTDRVSEKVQTRTELQQRCQHKLEARRQIPEKRHAQRGGDDQQPEQAEALLQLLRLIPEYLTAAAEDNAFLIQAALPSSVCASA